MSARLKIFLVLLTAPGCGCFSGGARAADAINLFETGNKLYEERKFAEAATAYEKVLDSGQISTALYFNLGNAFFKSSQTGRAILAYRRAALLTPRDPDIRANLQFARNQVEGPTLRPSTWQRALSTLSLHEWTVLSAAGLWLTLVLLAVAQLRPALRAALRTSTFAAGGATFLLAACLFLSLSSSVAARTVVIIAKNVTVRNGPLEESQSAFSAHDGAELQVLDRKDDWLQVSDGTRRIGWLRRTEVAQIDRS